jgi:hypothetical protein
MINKVIKRDLDYVHKGEYNIKLMMSNLMVSKGNQGHKRI